MSRFVIILSGLSLLCMPFLAHAQAVLKSNNYELDGINFGSNFTLTSGTSSKPPQISTDGPNVLELTPSTAKIEWVTDKAASSTINYGATTAYGQETGSSSIVTDHVITIFGLQPETTYHFQVSSTDVFGSSASSDDRTFTTPAEAGINSIKVSDVSYDRALISWTTGLFTSSSVEYGPTIQYGKSESTSSRSFTTDHTLQLTNLTPGTDYHFRIVAQDDKGNTTRSSDAIFTTIANPAFTSVTAKPGINDTEIDWTTNVFTTAVLTYKSDRDSKAQTAGDSTASGSHSVILKNLFGQTQYTYSLTATDNQGKRIESGNKTFTTQTDTVPPVFSNLKVAVTLSGNDLVVTVTWTTNKPSDSKVTYAPKTDPQNITDLPLNSNYVTQHVVVSTGLSPSTPYTLKAISADPFGNKAEQAINFVTPGLKKSIFQLILDNILNSFGPFIKLFGNNPSA